MRVAVIGDATLDVSVAASRPMLPGGDAPARISLGPGGQGANVAVRLARRGVDVWLISPVGEDPAGALLRAELARERVKLNVLAAARTASVVAMLDGSGERTMLSDRVPLEAAALGEHLQGATWVHCSGYPLLDAESGDDLAALLGALPVPVSVAGGSVSGDRPALPAAFRRRLERIHPRLLVLSLDEAAALTGERQPQAAVVAMASLAELPVVTAGEQGAVAWLNGETIAEPAVQDPAPIIDSTGAGDAYAAVLIAELAPDDAAWPPQAQTLEHAMGEAAALAGRVARVIGAQAVVAGERVLDGSTRT